MSFESLAAAKAVTQLRAQLGVGQVLSSGTAYDESIAIWNAAAVRRPALVVRCRTTADVQAAIRVARRYDIPLSVRGAGHDLFGRALRQDGLVIDLTGMRQVSIDPAGRIATVQGGVDATGLVAAAEPHGLVAVTGTVGSVGMLGLTLGGGYGALTSRFGLAADNLISAEVVLADGSVVHADAEQNVDLYWALRGGGGNFGVVTSARIRLHPLTEVLTGLILYPFAHARDVLGALDDRLTDAPDELTIQHGLVPGPEGEPLVFLAPVWSGEPDAGEQHIAALTYLGPPVSVQIGPATYGEVLARNTEMYPYGGHARMGTRTVAGLTSPVVDALIEGAKNFTSPLSALNIHHFHGAPTRVPVESAAFGVRTPHLVVEIIGRWPVADPSAESHAAWVRSVDDALAPAALPGGYAGLLGPDAHHQIQHAYGPNAARLLEIKARWDQDSTFTAIPLPR